MNFFERQAQARRNSTRLIALFSLAVLGIVLMVGVLVLIVIGPRTGALLAAAVATLAVIGLVQPDSGVFPLAHWQSVAVAQWLRLRLTDPARAAAVQQKESVRPLGSWSRRRVVNSERHWFEVDHLDYLRSLESLLNQMEPTS
jgi:hypothetical protein